MSGFFFFCLISPLPLNFCWSPPPTADQGTIEDKDVRRLLSRGLAFSAYTIAGVALLHVLGVDTSGLVTGLSVSGITLGFAARDVAANYISGIMILITRPFKTGEKITVGTMNEGATGVVQRIDMR